MKPLLYIYRMPLTGIHLIRSGEVKANLPRLNETAKLPYIPDLIAHKLAGPEKGALEAADMAFQEREYERLRAELESAYQACRLPETPRSAETLNELLVRVRLTRKLQVGLMLC